MYLSLNWLKDFVKLPQGTTPEELASRLTLHTVEVEKIENQAAKFDKVVVGKILSVKQHPNADRLQLAEVEVGKNNVLNIVCGAPNIAVGQKVPVALIGAKLPNGLEIKQAEVRGESSSGMLCASDELGLGDDHSGILILNDKAKIGEALAEHLGFDDQILEVDNKSLTNRPDLWCHRGMAREVSAFLDCKFSDIKTNPKVLEKKQDGFKLDVKVEANDLCQRYMAIGIEGIAIADSPAWMQKRLLAVGMRPINNIVDITNYVMIELGQPLHAFDRELVDRIVVRQAKQGEVMETLDGQKRSLESSMLVIADSSKPIALAGVMGGNNSEIRPETNKIVFESANFDYVSIRKTSTKLGLRTESSMRFEKGLDPNLTEQALIRAVELTLELCPEAKVVTETIDICKARLNDIKKLTINLDWLASKIGEAIKTSRVIDILQSLGFTVEHEKHDLLIKVPTWRATRDIDIPEDIVEEVARIYGYNNIASVMPRVEMLPPERNSERQLERRVKSLLASAPSLYEVYNYSFVGDDQLSKLRIDASGYLHLANPIASDQTMLRQSLAPNLIFNVRSNQARFKEFGLFEIGGVYLNIEGEYDKGDTGGKLPYQEKRLGLVVAGDDPETVFNRQKGIVEYLLTSLGLEWEWRAHEVSLAWANTSFATDLYVHGKLLGSIAVVDNRVAKSLGLKREAAVAELSFKQLFRFVDQGKVKRYQEESKFPAIVRDLAFVVSQKVLYSELRTAIVEFDQLIKSADLFDVYQGDKLGPDMKSLAFHIVYQADRTMISEEVDQLQTKLISFLSEKFEAKLRDF